MLEKGNFEEEEKVNEAFREVRNHLRKHYPSDIVFACIKRLNEKPTKIIQHLTMYPPWRLLLLIKWTFVYGEYYFPYRETLTVKKFNSLLNLMHKLTDYTDFQSINDVFLFFRMAAFQQFWLQHEFNMVNFARQSLLFGKLDNEHPFKKIFIEKCGVSISEFIELAMMIMTRFTIEKEISVTAGWFRTVVDKYEPRTIQNFLDVLSTEFNPLKEKLIREQPRNRKVSYEVYEQTPLRENPLLKQGSIYYPFSTQLLARCLETFIYDTLRRDNAEDFMKKFGRPIFEKYVGDSIARTKIKYFNEKELANILPGKGKIVDYLLMDGNNRIFIDAKGVELSYLGKVEMDPRIIMGRTRDSIVKGIKQGLETAKRLKELGRIGEMELGKGDNYLIVVTFKDMYVGNGEDFYKYIVEDKLDRIIGQSDNLASIPFKHMYFMSIDDFDLLTSGIVSGGFNLTEIFDHAVKCDALWKTKKLTFGQHIYDKYPQKQVPVWLVTEAKQILERCRLRFNAKT